jgi:hypothetical protein
VAKSPCLITAAVVALIVFWLTGGTSARPVEGPVRLGQIASVNGPRVRAERVIEDTRCPADVQCVQAGRVIVQVTVFGGGWSRRFDLQPGVPVNVADGSLTLVGASPLPQATQLTDRLRSYRFTFSFQGGL